MKMNSAAAVAFHGDLSPVSQCIITCYPFRASPYYLTTFAPTRTFFSNASRLRILSSRSSNRGIACQAVTETQPESDNEKEKELYGDGTSQPLDDGLVESNGFLDPKSISSQDKDEFGSTNSLDLKDTLEKNDGDLVTQDTIQEKDGDLEVASGSPLPGMKQQLGDLIRIPKATIDILKDQVFGFDTFFVTSQEPYEGGILFKGNLRGKAANSYEKIAKRMLDRFGDQFKLFLLTNPEDDKPVAVVVPRQTLQPESTAVPEWFAAGAFGLVTIFTLLLRNVPALQSNILYEIGSFGAITRIISIVPNREDLLKLAAAGPLAGFSLGLILLLLGFVLPPTDGIGIVVDPMIFHESFLAGSVAKFLLGDGLKEGTPLSVNPLVIWAWAGLLINAINSIPAGELDGGRISFAIWGRKASARLTGAAIALLGLSSLFNDVAFYWVALIFILQRGPIAPLSDEISEPDAKYVGLGVAVLLLGLLVCLPYPFPFNTQGMSFSDL